MSHFTRKEFACNCGCGFDTIDYELLEVLEDVREHFNSPVHINSGCRCESWNKKIGGEDGSQHTKARAADIVVVGIKETIVADYLESKYPDKYGIGRYSGRTHIDTRSGGKARWTAK